MYFLLVQAQKLRKIYFKKTKNLNKLLQKLEIVLNDCRLVQKLALPSSVQILKHFGLWLFLQFSDYIKKVEATFSFLAYLQ